MVTTEVTISREQIIGINHPLEYVGIDWETYKDISVELDGLKSFHLAYSGRILTIMPISDVHEFLSYLLGQFMGLVSLATRTNIIPTGSATLRSKTRLIGVEPDLSFFVANAGSHRLKGYVPDEIDLPPDIVIEIDISRTSHDKCDIYSRLGVSEFWQYDGKLLKMFKLNNRSSYELTERSEELPILTGEILTQFLNRGKAEEGQFKLLTDFQNWLQNSNEQ